MLLFNSFDITVSKSILFALILCFIKEMFLFSFIHMKYTQSIWWIFLFNMLQKHKWNSFLFFLLWIKENLLRIPKCLLLLYFFNRGSPFDKIFHMKKEMCLGMNLESNALKLQQRLLKALMELPQCSWEQSCERTSWKKHNNHKHLSFCCDWTAQRTTVVEWTSQVSQSEQERQLSWRWNKFFYFQHFLLSIALQ